MNKNKDYEQLCLEIYSSVASGVKWECRCKGDRSCSDCEIGRTCPDENWRPYRIGEAIHPDFEYRQCLDSWVVNRHKGDNDFVIKYIVVSDEEFNKNWKSFGYYHHGTEKECLEYVKDHQEESWFNDVLDEMLKPDSLLVGECTVKARDIFYYEQGAVRTLKELKKRLKPYKTISVNGIVDILYKMGIKL